MHPQDGKIYTRNDDYIGQEYVDFVIFFCPIRNSLSAALMDKTGYYWTYPKWDDQHGVCYPENVPGRGVKFVNVPKHNPYPYDTEKSFLVGCLDMLDLLNSGELIFPTIQEKKLHEEIWRALYEPQTLKSLQRAIKFKHRRTIRTRRRRERLRKEQELEDAETS